MFFAGGAVWRMGRESLFHANRFNFDWFNWKWWVVSSFGSINASRLTVIYRLRTIEYEIILFDVDKNIGLDNLKI